MYEEVKQILQKEKNKYADGITSCLFVITGFSIVAVLVLFGMFIQNNQIFELYDNWFLGYSIIYILLIIYRKSLPKKISDKEIKDEIEQILSDLKGYRDNKCYIIDYPLIVRSKESLEEKIDQLEKLLI